MTEEVEYKEDARDGDGDGLVQDGTEFERPAKEKAPKEKAVKAKDVALFSNRNISWSGVGRLSKGYTIVKSEDVDKWLTLKGVRVATPKEVAEEYGL